MRAAEAGAYAPPALARRRGVVLDLPGGGRGVARVVARLRRLGAPRELDVAAADEGGAVGFHRKPSVAEFEQLRDCLLHDRRREKEEPG